jgi:hypothetical protein
MYLMSPEESTPLTPSETSAYSPKGGATYSHPGLAQKIEQSAEITKSNSIKFGKQFEGELTCCKFHSL